MSKHSHIEALAHQLRLANARQIGIANAMRDSEKYSSEPGELDTLPDHPAEKIKAGLEELRSLVAEGDLYAAARVRDFAMLSIRILETSPVFIDMARDEPEWPQIVPCGPIKGPLFEAWVDDWAALGAGAGLRMPQATKAKFQQGKPAGLAFRCYRAMVPVWMEGEDDPMPVNPAWADVVRRLPALTEQTAMAWRDAALMMMEESDPDFRAWLAELPGNYDSAAAAMKRKATGKVVSRAIKAEKNSDFPPDSATAKTAVKKALLTGFNTVASGLEFDLVMLYKFSGEHP